MHLKKKDKGLCLKSRYANVISTCKKTYIPNKSCFAYVSINRA